MHPEDDDYDDENLERSGEDGWYYDDEGDERDNLDDYGYDDEYRDDD